MYRRFEKYPVEMILAVTLVGFSTLVGISNPAFLSAGNLFDLLRNSIVFGILALGVMVALASGGIDVSFTAVAIFALYVTTRLLPAFNFEGSVAAAFVIAAALGLLLGFFNAFFVSVFQLPTLIVTLGTLSLFRGFLLTVVGTEYITVLPAGMVRFSQMNLLEGSTASGGAYRLPAAFLALVLVALVTWFILNRTWMGRGIYALGGSAEAASRVGFNTRRLQFFIYGYIGLLAGIAGVIHGSLNRGANPFDLVGEELAVIAAVVLGGARITGGYGSVIGTLLGVAIITVIGSSLILLGLPSYWHKVAVGALILIGTGLTSFDRQAERSSP